MNDEVLSTEQKRVLMLEIAQRAMKLHPTLKGLQLLVDPANGTVTCWDLQNLVDTAKEQVRTVQLHRLAEESLLKDLQKEVADLKDVRELLMLSTSRMPLN